MISRALLPRLPRLKSISHAARTLQAPFHIYCPFRNLREIDDYDLFAHVVVRGAPEGDRIIRNPHQHRQTGPIKTVERNPVCSHLLGSKRGGFRPARATWARVRGGPIVHVGNGDLGGRARTAEADAAARFANF
jgi:hypothetical protein